MDVTILSALGTAAFVAALAVLIVRVRRRRDAVDLMRARSPVPIVAPTRRRRFHILPAVPLPSARVVRAAADAPPPPPDPRLVNDPVFADLTHMFQYMGVCSGKGVLYDTISAGGLRRDARLSSPKAMADFLHHYAVVHPELIDEHARYAEESPEDVLLYQLKAYDAFLGREKIGALLHAMREGLKTSGFDS